ncbi:MAG: hypothetical protein AB1450_13515 [Pseudomonadota bacterium]
MMLANKSRMTLAAVALLGLGLSGCATTEQGAARDDSKTGMARTAAVETSTMLPQQYFELHKDGRIWVFGDAALYKGAVTGKEVPLAMTRIGAGPKRETVVFGLTKDESKKVAGLGQVALFDGKLDGAAEGFYGEIVKDGRHYVFDGWGEMKAFRATGEAPYVFTYVGAGPKRATVVYVRNKAQSKAVPSALVARFRQFHSL